MGIYKASNTKAFVTPNNQGCEYGMGILQTKLDYRFLQALIYETGCGNTGVPILNKERFPNDIKINVIQFYPMQL